MEFRIIPNLPISDSIGNCRRRHVIMPAHNVMCTPPTILNFLFSSHVDRDICRASNPSQLADYCISLLPCCRNWSTVVSLSLVMPFRCSISNAGPLSSPNLRRNLSLSTETTSRESAFFSERLRGIEPNPTEATPPPPPPPLPEPPHPDEGSQRQRSQTHSHTPVRMYAGTRARGSSLN